MAPCIFHFQSHTEFFGRPPKVCLHSALNFRSFRHRSRLSRKDIWVDIVSKSFL
nr:MAG TPA: hypothetical protein [Caudoviricetes sp.]